MKRFKTLFSYPEAWVLTLAALVTRLIQIHQPPAVVFDEIYFRSFAGNYLNGQYFFDIHPPFVKLLFAGVASILNLSPPQLIGDDPAGVVLRVVPALAGAALVPLVYIIIRQFGLGRRMAAFGALLILLDNALLVESRFVLMDSLLLLFGFGALSSYLALRKSSGMKRWVWVILTAMLIGMLVTTKWTGLAMAGLIAALWLIDAIWQRKHWQRTIGEGFLAVCIIAVIYIGSFMIHFGLLTKSGDGDPFMTSKFQSTLVGNPLYDKNTHMSFWDKFVELNGKMYTAQSSLNDVTHPYSSKWYSWPVEVRSVYYWQGQADKNGVQGNIYLLGNPAVWWLSAVGVAAAFITWIVRPKLLGERRRLIAFLLVGYALNFVPFAFIDRPMFLYHYLFALVFAILLACVMLALFFGWQRQKYGARAVQQTYWALVAVVVLSFLYFVPLSYGWPLSSAELQQRMWLPTWR